MVMVTMMIFMLMIFYVPQKNKKQKKKKLSRVSRLQPQAPHHGRVPMATLAARIRQEVGDNVMLSFDVLPSEAVGTVEDESGELRCDKLDRFKIPGVWWDLS